MQRPGQQSCWFETSGWVQPSAILLKSIAYGEQQNASISFSGTNVYDKQSGLIQFLAQ